MHADIHSVCLPTPFQAYLLSSLQNQSMERMTTETLCCACLFSEIGFHIVGARGTQGGLTGCARLYHWWTGANNYLSTYIG